MAYTLFFEEQVVEDYERAKEYYATILASLEERFSTEFLAQLGILENNPFLYQERYRSIRLAHLKSFPYSVHYIIEEERVYILRLLHQKQYWE